MNVLLSLLVAILFSVGMYQFLQKDLMRLIIAILILSNAANLLIFTAGGLKSRVAPLIPEGDDFLPLNTADPVPQALILTAIVIGLGVIAFFLILSKELYKETKNVNISELRSTEE